jgi:hypothetical protein
MSIKKPILFIIALFFSKGLALGAMSISDIADRFSDAVVTVSTYNEKKQSLSWGSGFFVNEKGEIATSHHLFTGAFGASITTRKGKKGDILELIGSDPNADLVIARTDLTHETSLTLGDSDKLFVGDRVVALGNSGGLTGAVSLGTIEGFFPVSKIEVIQINAPLSSGGSGGPLLDLNGEVIGISTAFLRPGVNLNFAMPVNRLKALKPMHLDVAHLPGRTVRLEAVLSGSRLVELALRNHQPSLIRETVKDRSERMPASNTLERKNPPPGTVYFKRGKRLVCERAWMIGNTIFLVVQGKKFALGYDQNQIDMKRSFILYL